MANQLDMLERGENRRRNRDRGDRPFGGIRKSEGITTFGLDPAERERHERSESEVNKPAEETQSAEPTETQERVNRIRSLQQDAELGDPKSLLDLGDAWEEFGDVARARRAREMGVEHAQRMARADPENPEGLASLADAWDRLGESKRAEKARRMAKNVFEREYSPDPLPRVEARLGAGGAARPPGLESPSGGGRSLEPGSPVATNPSINRRRSMSIF